MQLHTLRPKTARKSSKRIGRGGAHGKTSGRGHKGQKARAGHRIRPAVRDVIKRLPKRRGRGTHAQKSRVAKHTPVNLSVLEAVFSDGERVTPQTLTQRQAVSRTRGKGPLSVKILGQGTLSKKLAVSGCAVSETARKQIEGAGGSIA